ncbi:MAG: DUF721 domain-containing protein [Acidimicrobiia bacterium]
MTTGDEPVRIDESLSRVARELGLPVATGFHRLSAEWEHLVGGQIAAHSRPRVLRAGVLTVDVDAPAWATQIRYLETELLDRLRPVVDGTELTSIRVIVGSPAPRG